MRGMTTLGEVKEQVEAMAVHHHDEMVPVEEISFDNLETVVIGGKSHYMRPVAQRGISARCGIPYTYLARCPGSLQAVQLRYWLKHERNEELFFRFDRQEVRAVFTPRYVPADNHEVLARLEEIGMRSDTKVQVALDAEFLSLSILDQDRTFAVMGDRLTPGISVSNSEVGLASLSVTAFFLRLVCTNGLIAKTGVSASYRHVSERVLAELPQALGQVQGQLETSSDKIKISMESKVDDPDATFRSLNRQFQLGQREQEAVAWGFMREFGDTMWHVVNAYTAGAQHGPLTAEESHRLQTVGGMVLGMVS